MKTEEENLQAAARQNARLKADLKAAQQEKDSLKREVAVLHKKLLHTQEKVGVLLVPEGSPQQLLLRAHLCV